MRSTTVAPARDHADHRARALAARSGSAESALLPVGFLGQLPWRSSRTDSPSGYRRSEQVHAGHFR
eukprot:CAMPEP_0176076506 /NCGR_PEP_ID=MMETSP0120_2-20121206/38246_1 /TAXON_ID=160619 /ORGANISM="Kryptoperidinium foliaceum, Strain CCMP 1326" /LENGTH=65 /DNA_ID=CAMNT_0017410225 /DNA_START=57 /DNA_END=250 /DNA_ORIENTATION=+